MKLTTTGRQEVTDIPYGVYVALDENEKYIVDEDYNHLSIMSKKGDPKRTAELRAAAASLGFENIILEFRPGARQVTDEQYEEQMTRMKLGLVPDPEDLGVALDEYGEGTVG